MIDEIRIKNFQCHDNLKIQLDPKVTVLVGDSDVGKSSILRALWWVFSNRPSGAGFIRHGQKRCRVGVRVDGKTIIRERGTDGTNTYRFGQAEYKSFGADVPDAVAKHVAVSDINYAGQHDSPFWMMLSAGEVSRQLNAVVDLQVIDDALSRVAKDVNQCRQVVKITTDRLDDATKQRDGLQWVKEADADYKRVEKLKVVADEVLERRDVLDDAIDMMEIKREECQRLQECVVGLKAVLAVGTKAVDLESRRFDLAGKIQTAESAQMVASRGYPDISALAESVEVWKEARQRASGLKRLLSAIQETSEFRAAFIETSQSAHGELEQATDGACPICGREFV